MTLKGIWKTNYMWGGGSRSQVEIFVFILVAVHSFSLHVEGVEGSFVAGRLLPSSQMLKGSSTGPLRAGGQRRLSFKYKTNAVAYTLSFRKE